MTVRVLAVDDSTSVRKMVEFVLRSQGLEVQTVGDGQAALTALGQEPFDLVVLDINMPRLDGLSLLRMIRERPEWDNLAVLMLTTEGKDADIGRAMALGATAYLTKPFKPTELLEQVTILMKGRKRS